MSQASEWAKRDKARAEKLHAARERIEAELGRDGKDKPGPFLDHSNVLGEVTHHDGCPHLVIPARSMATHLDGPRAVQFADWIKATFGDGPRA